MAAALAGAGYRVLAPDLRGYSPGARPAARAAYRNSELAADVLALADAAGAERFHLAGHDWGAALAWYVAGRHPERVASLAALSVPHPQAFVQALVSSSQLARSWYMAAWQLPWLPEQLLSRRDGQMLRDILTRTGLDPASAERYALRARDPATLRGPLNWYRAMPLSLREPAGPVRVPTMFIWGNRDRFVTRAAAERLRAPRHRAVSAGRAGRRLPLAARTVPGPGGGPADRALHRGPLADGGAGRLGAAGDEWPALPMRARCVQDEHDRQDEPDHVEHDRGHQPGPGLP